MPHCQEFLQAVRYSHFNFTLHSPYPSVSILSVDVLDLMEVRCSFPL
jgi:hypothetical protein